MHKDEKVNAFHGDVLLVRVKMLPDGEVKRVSGRYVVAEGEQTGHAHVIHGEIELVRGDNGLLYISNEDPVTITHEEHGPRTIEPGIWKVDFPQEYDHLEQQAQRVRD